MRPLRFACFSWYPLMSAEVWVGQGLRAGC